MVLLLLLLCIESVISLPLSPKSSPQSLPLYNALFSSNTTLADRALFEAAKLKTRYGVQSTENQKRQSSVPLTNINADSSYYAEIRLGSQETAVKVLVDTGSADLWLAATNCTDCSSTTPRYSQAASSTLDVSDEEFSIRYGSGSASGILASDSMEWGSYAVENQTFALCDQVSDGLLHGSVSGLLGLGFRAIANSDAQPFWQASGINEMSFALTRYLHDSSASSTEPGGYLTLGGTNSSLYTGQINYHPLASESYWLLEMDAFRINGSAIDSTRSLRAAIDTGTSLIGAPVDVVRDIYSAIPGAFKSEDESFQGYYEFPCDAKFNTSIGFDGVDYPIYSTDFNLGTTNVFNDTQYCLGAVFELTTAGLPPVIIGNTLLKSYYTVFRADPPAVGFATLANSVVQASYAASSAYSLSVSITLLIIAVILSSSIL